MATGCGANYADVIESKNVAKICGKVYKQFLYFLNAAGESLGSYANALDFNEEYEDDSWKDVRDAFKEVQEEFEKKTGLTLGLSYHDGEQGDCYDEVRNEYFYVDGMYELTKAGKKIGKKVQRKLFVNFE